MIAVVICERDNALLLRAGMTRADVEGRAYNRVGHQPNCERREELHNNFGLDGPSAAGLPIWPLFLYPNPN